MPLSAALPDLPEKPPEGYEFLNIGDLVKEGDLCLLRHLSYAWYNVSSDFINYKITKAHAWARKIEEPLNQDYSLFAPPPEVAPQKISQDYSIFAPPPEGYKIFQEGDIVSSGDIFLYGDIFLDAYNTWREIKPGDISINFKPPKGTKRWARKDTNPPEGYKLLNDHSSRMQECFPAWREYAREYVYKTLALTKLTYEQFNFCYEHTLNMFKEPYKEKRERLLEGILAHAMIIEGRIRLETWKKSLEPFEE